MTDQTLYRPRRSALYIPVSNDKALAKAASLDCDVVIFDLEDAVAPADKPAARAKLATVFAAPAGRAEVGAERVGRAGVHAEPVHHEHAPSGAVGGHEVRRPSI